VDIHNFAKAIKMKKLLKRFLRPQQTPTNNPAPKTIEELTPREIDEVGGGFGDRRIRQNSQSKKVVR